MKTDCTEIIFFGRLEERKGLPEFICALNHLADGEGPEFRVTFVGKVVRLYAAESGGMDSRAYIATKLHKNLKFSINDDLDSRAAIDFVRNSANAVICLASPSDNFPNAALEMGQLRKRLVVSDTKGFHQTLGLIGRTEALHWFKPGCPLSLAEAIRAAMSHRGGEPCAPSASDLTKLNEHLLEERLGMLNSAFDSKRKRCHAEPRHLKNAVVFCTEETDMRAVRRSLLSFDRSNLRPDHIVVVVGNLAVAKVRRLSDQFPDIEFRQSSAGSLQDLLRSDSGGAQPEDYAVLMMAGVALGRGATAHLGKATNGNPALIVSAESVLGSRPQCLPFQPPSVSRLVRANTACGSCLTASVAFLGSLPPLEWDRPTLTLWLLVLAAAAQGKSVSYFPLPLHSLRLRHGPNTEPRPACDEELALLWRYLSGLAPGSWSRRELRNLVLSVQQLGYHEQQLQYQLQLGKKDLERAEATNAALQAELDEAKSALAASKNWGLRRLAAPFHFATRALRSLREIVCPSFNTSQHACPVQ